MTRLRINEIFHSIQGEGTRAGMRCAFIRLTGCHLRCSWCDTEYAFYEGSWKTLDEILSQVRAFGCPVVEVTGGEPLLQPGVYPLLTALCDEYSIVMLETSGAVSMEKVDSRVIRIMDLKCPGSGEAHRNHWSNIDLLRATDEVKFVIADRADYEWTRNVIRHHRLIERCPVLLNPVFDRMRPADLAEWVIADRLDVRVGMQLHKFIWTPLTRGV
ncbi:MAG: radical SAM protein [Phycisphaerales bacterium]|nr:radical SAM protein [Phycisphaerales bacterium]